MKEQLKQWIDDVLRDQIQLSDNINNEAQENLWVFTFSYSDLEVLTRYDFEDFLQLIIINRRKKIEKLGKKGIFYVWFDDFSGSLRFSIISSSNISDLPFNCEIKVVYDLKIILDLLFYSPYLEGIPEDELKEIDLREENENVSQKTNELLQVYCCNIP